MILLWKAVVLEMGAQRLKAYTQKFWFAEYLHKNTWRPLFGGYTKKMFWWSLWERICRQKLHKNLFGRVWENSGKNPSPPKKFACSYTYDEKSHPPPLPLFWKGRGGKALVIPPFSGVSVHVILHAVSLLVVVGCNVSLQWI